ncbi:DNA excision repair protein ERCC-1 [Fopius arisanus]|uniref:DNA excision repair protein ERCC-1 n=1 Tax=Fopius arisanus TaxID=64838 RepID=A0A0C9R016_9HYME|nr:PREDICTED: DNA excision repair protein ERCC-1 [Fopius arisanus]
MSELSSTSKESAEPSLSKKTKIDDNPPVALSKPTSGLTILVNQKQKGNPLLKYMKNLPWAYSDIVPDYVMGPRVCALFLSLRYHQLNPDYLHDRLKLLGSGYQLRVLLVQIDVAEPNHSLKHLTRICILADLTLMLAWSAEEAAKMIETYKSFENKPPDMIMERADADPHQQVMNALTTIRSINKTDAMTLMTVFGSLAAIVKASPTALSLCPGIGPQKAQRLHKVLHEKFIREDSSKDKPGPSNIQAGSSGEQEDPSNPQPGPSSPKPGPSSPQPGPSSPQPGPSTA